MTLAGRELQSDAAGQVKQGYSIISQMEAALKKAVLPQPLDPLTANARLQSIYRAHANSVEDAALKSVDKGKQFRKFRFNNNIEYDLDYERSIGNLVFSLLGIITLEAGVNSYLFAQASDSGLLGGFITAFGVSVVNVASGFVAGFGPFRYISHVNRLHLIWSIPGFVLFVAFAFLFNLAVGHHRDFLSADPDAPFSKALVALIDHPITFQSFDSIVLVVIGLGIFLWSLHKGGHSLGRYPGYRAIHKDWADAAASLSALKASVGKMLDDALKEELKSVRAIEAAINQRSAIIRTAGAGLSKCQANIDKLFLAQRSELASAVAIYRDANKQVRGRSVSYPGYFDKAVDLDKPSVDGEIEDLAGRIAWCETELGNSKNDLKSQLVELDKARSDALSRLEGVIANAEIEAQGKLRSFEESK